MSAESGSSEESQRSREVEKLLKDVRARFASLRAAWTSADRDLGWQDERKMRQQVKLLLLGAGASGKSTVLKQMRLIHNVAFSDSEIECAWATAMGAKPKHRR